MSTKNELKKNVKNNNGPQNGQGLIQEVAIGNILAEKVIHENQIKKG